MQANDSSASASVIVGQLASHNAEAVEGTAGNGRLHLGRALVDESTDGITPAGGPGGGPIVGPYEVAARNRRTFARTGSGGVTITPSTSTSMLQFLVVEPEPMSIRNSYKHLLAEHFDSANGATVTFNAIPTSDPRSGVERPADLSSSTCTGTTNPC